MSIDPEVIRRLVGRGVKLHASATSAEISDFFENMRLDPDSDFQNVYSSFNGFAENCYDEASQIRIWNLSEILKESSQDIRNPPRIVFADFLINSEQFVFDKSSGLIERKFEGFAEPGSISQFVSDLALGRYDFSRSQ